MNCMNLASSVLITSAWIRDRNSENKARFCNKARFSGLGLWLTLCVPSALQLVDSVLIVLGAMNYPHPPTSVELSSHAFRQ